MPVVVHFLLVYDLHEQKLVSQQEYADGAEAAAAYADLERRHRTDQDFEIVLVGADSIDTIMKTHGQYFDGSKPPGDSSPYLVSVGR